MSLPRSAQAPHIFLHSYASPRAIAPMSKMRPGDFRFTGAFFLSRTHKTTVHTAASLHCSCPANRDKGNLLLAPATLSNTVREAKKKLGLFLFYWGRFDGNIPINRKTHRNGYSRHLGLSKSKCKRSFAFHKFSSMKSTAGLPRGLGTLPEGRPQWAKTLAEKGRNKTKREQKLFALCCL